MKIDGGWSSDCYHIGPEKSFVLIELSHDLFDLFCVIQSKFANVRNFWYSVDVSETGE
jgi:hypothetical protein